MPCGRSAVATHIDCCDPSSRVVPVAIPASVGHGIGRVDPSRTDLHHRLLDPSCIPWLRVRDGTGAAVNPIATFQLWLYS